MKNQLKTGAPPPLAERNNKIFVKIQKLTRTLRI